MNLRLATPADLALLRRWDGEPHVVASDPDDGWFSADDCFVYRLDRREYERRRAIGQSAKPAPPAR